MRLSKSAAWLFSRIKLGANLRGVNFSSVLFKLLFASLQNAEGDACMVGYVWESVVCICNSHMLCFCITDAVDGLVC